ncbi:receptor-like protein kinase [Seminavis robusta]|uniref:Receptor-like protein kinase n=1 Tax=Seminavis robusta TaxID=568900 RepID=A0A9N8E440_9STRA|nr:receptor-like protein kinase [Seminavis robusta]|eukprot:Sro628_g178010.1 receptor-like protein kinase (496) ;mRNA; r:11020-13028
MKIDSVLLAAVVTPLFGTVGAFPGGAGDCPEARAAVGGPHLGFPTVTTGSLEEGQLQFEVNGGSLAVGEPNEITVGDMHTWTLEITDGIYRGFLVRLGGGDSGVDTVESIKSDLDIVQPASACENFQVGGVTHTNAEDKTIIEGTLSVDAKSANMPLDVTVVIENTNGVSIYYYTGYQLTAVDSAGLETPGPETAVPTEAESEAEGEETEAPGTDVPAEETEAPAEETEAPAEETDAPAEETDAPAEETDAPAPDDGEETEAPAETVAPTEAETVAVGELPVEPGPEIPGPEEETEAPEEPDVETGAPDETDAPEEPDAEETDAPGEPDMTDVPDMTGAPGEPEMGLPIGPGPADLPLSDEADCSMETPCGLCQGDCNSDNDCEDGLICYKRPGDDTSTVPGCSGEGVPGSDYCIVFADGTLIIRDQQCSETNPCSTCEGDCDSDFECEDGLVCRERDVGTNDAVPGCLGLGIPGLDYCYVPAMRKVRHLLRKSV